MKGRKKGQSDEGVGREQSNRSKKKCMGDEEEEEEVEGECCRASQALAALEFVALLPVSGWGDTNVHYVVAWRLVVCRSVRYLLLRHNAVDFC